MRERGDGVAGRHLALQEAVAGLGGDLVDELPVVRVRVRGQQLLLGDEVGGLTDTSRGELLSTSEGDLQIVSVSKSH